MRSERAFIGLGSNIPNRMDRLQRAAKVLHSLPETRFVRASPIYKTSPLGPKQTDFLNAVVEITTNLTPLELLDHLKAAEKEMGRKHRRRWGPREIDLDILFFGHRRIKLGSRLTVPHPRLRERKFVLIPLSTLVPHFCDPVTQKRVSSLLASLTAPSQTVKLYRRNWLCF